MSLLLLALVVTMAGIVGSPMVRSPASSSTPRP